MINNTQYTEQELLVKFNTLLNSINYKAEYMGILGWTHVNSLYTGGYHYCISSAKEFANFFVFTSFDAFMECVAFLCWSNGIHKEYQASLA